MRASDCVLIGRRVRIPQLTFVLTTTLAMGCVSLNKPATVEECATRHNCSNQPRQLADANQDTGEPGPDRPPGDKPDSGQDGAISDAPAGRADQGPEEKDVTGMDGRETGLSSDADSGLPPVDQASDKKDVTGTDGKETGISSDASDVPPADSKPELGPETIRHDAGPDLAPDASPDLPGGLDTSPLLVGLLAYYKCEGATGTTLADSSGKGNDGTLVAGTTPGYTFPAGKTGNALALSKAGQGYVSLPPAIFANATAITIATWVNVTTAQNWQRVFDVGINAKLSNNTATGTRYMNLVPKNDGTNLVFAISSNGINSEQKLTSTALSTGTWKHVALVLGSGQGILYVDGTAVSTSAISLRPVDLGAIDYAYLGKSQFGADPYFDGQIDEFRVYGRDLSAAEIQALYQF